MKVIRSFDNDYKLSKDEINIIEEEIYKYLKIPNNIIPIDINYNDVKKREVAVFKEKNYNRPQAIFYISLNNNIKIFGRKIISELYLQNKIPSKNCSLINKDMIIGILKKDEIRERNIIIKYYPLEDGERKYLFDTIIKKNDKLDIYYPFRFYDYDKNIEVGSPPEGWKIADDTQQTLFNGEIHLRKYTNDFLSNLTIERDSIFFDPACSTGDFLYYLKENNPQVITIGQDLGKDMVECSKKKLDKVYLGNSINTPIKDESVDFMFLRFLNSKVVTTNEAMDLYDALIRKVKKGGYIVCFGHTPVLLDLKYLIKDNFELICCNGYSEEFDSVFQYYVLKKI